MAGLSELVLRLQLRDRFAETLEVAEIHPMPNDIDRSGKPFLARDRLKIIYSGRVRGLQLHGNSRDSRSHAWQAALQQLDQVARDEPLYSWTAIVGGRRVGGVSTPERLIIVTPEVADATQN